MATEKFHYKSTKGDITLTRPDQLPMGVVRRVRALSEVEQTFAFVEAAADEQSLAVIDELLPSEFEKVMLAWQKSGEVTPGE